MSTAAKMKEIANLIDFGEALIPKLAEADQAGLQADVDKLRGHLAKVMKKYFQSIEVQKILPQLGSPEAPGLKSV